MTCVVGSQAAAGEAGGLGGGLDISLSLSSPTPQNVGLEQVTPRERAA